MFGRVGIVSAALLALTMSAANPPLTITTTTLPNGTENMSYPSNVSVTASGGNGIYTFALAPGSSLPKGLGLFSNGSIVGIPSTNTAGTYRFTVTVTDTAGDTPASQQLTITILAATPPLSITTTSLPNGTVGVPYAATVTASGGTGPYTWSVSGLPAGWGITAATATTATLTGNPTAAITYNPVTITVTDSASFTASQPYSLTVNGTATTTLTVSPNLLALGNYTLGGTAPPSGTISVSSTNPSSLPFTTTLGNDCAWLVLSPSGGTTSTSLTASVNTTATVPTGNRSCVITFNASGVSPSPTLTVTATANAPPLTITYTSASLPTGTVGAAYSQSVLTASGGIGSYTWSATNLPNGLTISPSTGAITGTPTASGAPTVTITVTDSATARNQRQYTLTINPEPPPTITTTSPLTAGTVGATYSQTLSASGGTQPYTWGYTGQLPTGLTFSASGSITGTPGSGTAGAYGLALTVTDKYSVSSVPETVTLTINSAPTPTITTQFLPNGSVGTTYSAKVIATGGTGSLTFSQTGNFPHGLVLNTSTGAITGTPDTAASYPFTITVTDSLGAAAVQGYTVVISAANVLVITTSSLPNGEVGIAYSQTIAAINGTPPYTFSVSAGNLPAPLSLSATGVVTGTPSTAGPATFTVTVTDSAGASASRVYTAVTVQPALGIATNSLPSDAVGSAYPTQTLKPAGGIPPVTWTLASGNLPPGLSLDPSGTIGGTPNKPGTYPFTVAATDSVGAAATEPLSITATAQTGMTISPASLPNWTVGMPYAQTLTGADCTMLGLCTWNVTGNLPPGLNSGTGVVSGTETISGTPTTPGTYTFTVSASIAALLDTGHQDYTVTINAPPQITTTSLPGGTAGTAYPPNVSIAVSNGTPPYSFFVSAGSLPDGLQLNPSSGAITGTPTTAGPPLTFTVTATDAAKASAKWPYTVTISAPTVLTVTSPATLPNGTVGTAYSQPLSAAGGPTPYTWSLASGTLPDGLALDPGGTISGIPKSAGTSTFTVKVSDPSGATAQKQLSITIIAASQTPTLTLSGVPSTSTSGQQISFSLGLSSAYTAQVTGQVTLSFQPNAAASADDPAIQFSGGGRTAAFTVAANSTTAQFTINPVAFQTGTVAGTITLVVTSNLPGGNLTQTVTVARAAPVIQSVSVTQTTSGFQVQITGYSNTRELAGANFHFTAVSGQTVATSDLSVSLSSLAGQWFSSSTSNSFGGQLLLVVPFTVQQGAASGLSSVAVQLQNALDTSPPTTVNF